MFGCAAEEESSGTSRVRRGASTLAAGDDGEPSVGEHDVDDGNPNADTLPGAPTTQGANAPQFTVTLSDAQPALGLGEAKDINVTVTPKNGFTGAVNIAVAGLPAGVTAAPAVATVGAGPATAKITLKADATAAVTPEATPTALKVTGTAGTVSSTANANFKVAPKLLITIPMNVDALRAAQQTFRDDYAGPALGSKAAPLKTQAGNGIVFTVFNADSKQHIVHGAGAFQHGDTNNPIEPNAFEIQNGKTRTRTLNVGQNGTGYLHEGAQGVGASFKISVVAQ